MEEEKYNMKTKTILVPNGRGGKKKLIINQRTPYKVGMFAILEYTLTDLTIDELLGNKPLPNFEIFEVCSDYDKDIENNINAAIKSIENDIITYASPDSIISFSEEVKNVLLYKMKNGRKIYPRESHYQFIADWTA
jgi:hypothetical protein